MKSYFIPLEGMILRPLHIKLISPNLSLIILERNDTMVERKSRVPLEGWEFMISNGFGDNLTESVLDIYDCRGYYDRPRQGSGGRIALTCITP